MPVFRYRTLEQAERALPTYPPGGDNLRRLGALLRFAYRFVPRRRFPAGVFRYRTLTEAQTAGERWITAVDDSGRIATLGRR